MRSAMSDLRRLSPPQLLRAALLLAAVGMVVASVLGAGLVAVADDPDAGVPTAATSTTLLALPDLGAPLSPLDELQAAVQRTLAAPSARWTQVVGGHAKDWEVRGRWDGANDRTERRIVLSPAFLDDAGLSPAPATPEHPHYITVVEGRTLWFAAPYGSERTGPWVQSPTQLLGRSEPLRRAGAHSTPADVDPAGGVPIRPFLEATSATLAGEGPEGRRFDVALPGPAVAQWLWCNAVVPRTGLEPARLREVVTSASTASVTIGPEGTVVAARIDLAPTAADLAGAPGLERPDQALALIFTTIEVGGETTVARPDGTRQLGRTTRARPPVPAPDLTQRQR